MNVRIGTVEIVNVTMDEAIRLVERYSNIRPREPEKPPSVPPWPLPTFPSVTDDHAPITGGLTT